jgi:hypothetical protein
MAERAISDEAAEVQREAPRPRQIEPRHSRRGWATATGTKEGHSSRHRSVWIRQLTHRLLPGISSQTHFCFHVFRVTHRILELYGKPVKM